jgi:hypothetical protein
MGEHPNDISIEQIIDMESKEKARRIAEKEVCHKLNRFTKNVGISIDKIKRLLNVNLPPFEDYANPKKGGRFTKCARPA